MRIEQPFEEEEIQRLGKTNIIIKKKKKSWGNGAITELTGVRSLFKLRNISCFLIDLRSAMSSGSNKACSTTSAIYPTLPCWKSLIEASAGKGTLSNVMARVQVGTPTWELLLVSTRVYISLACLAPFWGLVSFDKRPFPHSTTLGPFCSFFLLWSAGSGRRGWVNGGGEGGGDWLGWPSLVQCPSLGTPSSPKGSIWSYTRVPWLLEWRNLLVSGLLMRKVSDWSHWREPLGIEVGRKPWNYPQNQALQLRLLFLLLLLLLLPFWWLARKGLLHPHLCTVGMVLLVIHLVALDLGWESQA